MLLALAVTTGSAPLAWTYRTGNYSWAVAVSSDGRYVIAGSDDMHTYFFDTSSLGGKPSWIHDASGYVRHVVVSSNASYAAAGDTAGEIFLFRSPVPGESASVFLADSAIEALAMSDGGTYLAGGDRQGIVYVFRTSQIYFPLWRYAVPGGVFSLSLSQSGALAAASTHGGLYFLGDMSSSSGWIWSFKNETSFPYVAISRDASYVVAGGSDGYVYLLNSLGELIGRQKLGGAVSALKLSTTADTIVAGSTNGRVSLCLVQGGLAETNSITIQRPVTSVAISENGKRVGVADLDGTISMFDESLGTPLWTFDSEAIVHSLSISDNGLVTAASDDTGSIYLFNEEVPERTNQTTLGIAFVSIICGILLAIYLAKGKKTSR